MKRILLLLALSLALAVPAWAATGSAVWTGATDQDWNVDTNWTPNQHPADGDTATFDGSEGGIGNLPTSNQPAGGSTINFIFTDQYSVNLDADILGSAGAAIGTISLTGSGSGASITIDANFTTATANTDSTFYVLAATTAVGDVVLNGGKLDEIGAGASVLDGNVTATAASTVDWGSGQLVVNGGFDAGGNTITYVATTGATLTCDQTSGLDLGTNPAPGLAVVIDCGADTVTLDANISCYSFTQTAGIFDGADNTITVNGGAVLYTAGTVNNTPALLFADDGNLAWASSAANRLGLVSVDSGVEVTQTATASIGGIKDGTGAGTWTGGAQTTTVRPTAATDWTFTGTMTGSAAVFMVTPTGDPISLTSLVDVGSRAMSVGRGSSATLTFAAGVTCGNLVITPNAGSSVTSTVIINGPSSGANLTLGNAGDATRIGALTLGSGYVHTFTGTVDRAGAGTTHALTIGGRTRLSGTFTGTDITVARATEGEIDCLGAGRVTAVTATGNRLVVRRAVDSSGNPVRSWDGDSCTNVRFLGRRVIGSGTTSSAIGIGN